MVVLLTPFFRYKLQNSTLLMIQNFNLVFDMLLLLLHRMCDLQLTSNRKLRTEDYEDYDCFLTYPYV